MKKQISVAVILLFIGLAFAPSINANMGKIVLGSKPDLVCNGSLNWADVKPGSTCTGSFEVTNLGDLDSLLNWEIVEWPKWGSNWSFNPESWNDLQYGDFIEVDVEVVAPIEPNQYLVGSIKLINTENLSDYCSVEVIMIVPFTEFIDISDLDNHTKQENKANLNGNFLVEIRNIFGGFGVHAEIVSGTDEDLDEVGWKISLSSGGLLFIGKKRTGMIDTLHAGETVKIWSFVFGIFGYGVMYKIRVSVFYNGDEIEQRDALGKLFGPYVSNIFLDPPINVK